MPLSALALVLGAAVVHATWNLLAKESRGGVAFAWAATLVGTLAIAPFGIAVAIAERPHFGAQGIAWVAVSGALQTVYFVLVQRAYRAGDLSLVYPLARGTAPVVAMLGGVLLFAERPSALAVAGGLTICAGVLSLAGRPRPEDRVAVGYALATAAMIATYTLWDKHAVDALDLPPVVYFLGAYFVMLVLLTGPTLRRRADLRRAWTGSRRAVLGVGVLGPLSYLLVLIALSTTAVSYVAPAREISIVVGTILGARVLKEGDRRRRLVASAVIVAGVVTLAAG
ncbi:MAG TPA: DMT family transporter [Solirubrobacteraceae bacterium]|jgi:drug/metabolite transporter (DMT)-like permease